MTYTYRCIGKGTTDSNGVAHITHDCSGNALSDDGYKGVGAGLMDFIASTDAPADISDGSFQSETYSILDCLVYDKGLSGSGNHNDSAWQSDYPPTISRGSDWTTVTNNSGTYRYLTAETGATGSYDFTPPICVEFDFETITTETYANLQIYDEENDYFSTWVSQNGHYKININENSVSWSINGVAQTGKTVTIDKCFVRFYLSNGTSFKFKNFELYPI